MKYTKPLIFLSCLLAATFLPVSLAEFDVSPDFDPTPTASTIPTATPTASPTLIPTYTPTVTTSPTIEPTVTVNPTIDTTTIQPTTNPTEQPTPAVPEFKLLTIIMLLIAGGVSIILAAHNLKGEAEP
jgi:hypothetical protein